MLFDIVTIFPEFFSGPLSCGLLKRAVAAGVLSVAVHNLRDHAEGPHLQVDDTPYGGGPGMVMKPEPIWRAVEGISSEGERPLTVLLSPQGRRFDQGLAARYRELPRILLVCGRYEGVDQRVVENLVDEELSIGDYVLAGGEIAAVAVMEAVVRLLPGAVGNPASVEEESFVRGILDYPQYTRPPEFRGHRVPAVLLTGNHSLIEKWRRERAEDVTRRNRPDLLGCVRG